MNVNVEYKTSEPTDRISRADFGWLLQIYYIGIRTSTNKLKKE